MLQMYNFGNSNGVFKGKCPSTEVKKWISVLPLIKNMPCETLPEASGKPCRTTWSLRSLGPHVYNFFFLNKGVSIDSKCSKFTPYDEIRAEAWSYLLHVPGTQGMSMQSFMPIGARGIKTDARTDNPPFII